MTGFGSGKVAVIFITTGMAVAPLAAAIDQHFGSVDQYLLQGLGVTKEEQAYLNAQLTE